MRHWCPERGISGNLWYGLRSFNQKAIKILVTNFPYNKKLKTEENFIRHVPKIEKVQNLRRMRNLTAEKKITIFKTLAISKIRHFSYTPTEIFNELNKLQKQFIWDGNNPEIKHSTLYNKYENGGLKCEYFVHSCQLTMLQDKTIIR